MPAPVLPDRANSVLAMTLAGDATVMAPMSVAVREAISQPYELQVTAVMAGPALPAADVLQKSACLTIRWAKRERKFHGIVREYVPLGPDMRGFTSCQLSIVPTVWALSQVTDCRIFQEKTAEDILKLVFAEGAVDVLFRVTGDKPTLPYRTQYNESCLQFATRIMEEAGWYYFFEQGESAEKLIVTDANASFADLGALPDQGAIVTGMRRIHGIARSLDRTADYNPESPTTEVKGEQETKPDFTGPLSLTSFSWPARATEPDAAALRTRLKMEAAEAAASLFAGTSEWVMLSAGHIFEVPGTALGLPIGKYGVRTVTHNATDETGINAGAVTSYGNSFEAFPEATPWREPMDTRRPRMDGVHAAIVIGAENEHVFTDDLGRVKVRFFWDHRVDATPGEGIWARVVQPWAGNGWGAQFIPRVGTEVACAFMNGDPDYPVVLGGLYNGQDAPIFLKADKDKSGFRSRSFDTKAGGTAEFSEFTFNDKKGNEEIFLHAQKDYKVNVENDLTLKVDNCRVVEIKANDTFHVKGKQNYKVTGDQSLTIEEGNRSVVVSKGNYDLAVTKGNMATKVETGNYDLKIAKGNATVKTDLGAVTIEAMQSITLKVGANSVKIDSTGITLSGGMVTVKGTTLAEMKAPMVKVSGDGMVMVQAGLVKIN